MYSGDFAIGLEVARHLLQDRRGLGTVCGARTGQYWGYDAAFMEACVPALTVSPERIATEPFFVVEESGTVVGYAALETRGAEAELTDLFVEPWAIGRG